MSVPSQAPVPPAVTSNSQQQRLHRVLPSGSPDELPENRVPDHFSHVQNPDANNPEPPPGVLEGWAPPPVPLHGPAYRSLTSQEKSDLVRMHRNLGHPAPMTLAEHLTSAGAAGHIIAGAREYQCDTCLESTQPRHQRPSKLHEPVEFNHTVGVDGFYFKGRAGFQVYVLHVIDEASCFHLGRRAASRHTSQAIRLLEELWLSWAGSPKNIYLDPAGEFRSEEWLTFLQGHNMLPFVTTDAWQRGRVERHGDVVKQMLARCDEEKTLT